MTMLLMTFQNRRCGGGMFCCLCFGRVGGPKCCCQKHVSLRFSKSELSGVGYLFPRPINISYFICSLPSNNQLFAVGSLEFERMGDKSNQQVTFPRCAKYLESIGFGEYLDEITNGFSDGWSSKSGKEISSWGTESLAEWIGGLKFLQCEGAGELIASSLLAEEIDGFTFMQIDENQWVRHLKLDLKHFLLLKCIRDGWNGAWGAAVEVPLGVPAAVVTGIVADLSGCDEELAKQLIEADKKCCASGAGLFYGVLIVLGHKEYMVDGDKWKAVGVSNEKFVLKRKNIPNGIQKCVVDPNSVAKESRASASHIISMTVTNAHHDAIKWDMGNSNSLIGEAGGETKVIIRYKSDPSKDMFQIGRMSEPLNDWTLRGPLHGDTQHGRTRGPRGQTGPVSRFACRIECDRLPPFKCRLFAAGFNADKVRCNRVWVDSSRYDYSNSDMITTNYHCRVLFAGNLSRRVGPEVVR